VKKLLLIVLTGLSLLGLASCSDDANVASDNISKDADNFKVNRRIVAVNNYTNDYVLTVEGWCNIDADETEDQLEITCKVGADGYKKHFVGLSGLSYFVEQLEASNVSVDHYKVTFKPTTVIPDIEAR
jgi:hypothetical protein